MSRHLGRVSLVVGGIDDGPIDERAPRIRALLTWAFSLASRAVIDAFTDEQDPPAEVVRAVDVLKGKAPVHHRRFRPPEKTYMAIPVDLTDAVEREIFLAFAPYSIHAEVLYDDNDPLLILDDTSTGIEVRLQSEHVAAFEAALPEGGTIRRTFR